MQAKDCSVRNFMKSYFDRDFTTISEPDIKDIYTEYVDIAGLFETEEFARVCHVHYLNNRINSVRLSIKLQTDFLEGFGTPYIPELKFFNKFGHKLMWHEDKKRFLDDLKKIELKENKYISTLESKMKELIELRKSKSNNEQPKELSRNAFIRTLNSLGKMGYKIDKDDTMMDEVALMIKQQSEEAEQIKNSRKQ